MAARRAFLDEIRAIIRDEIARDRRSTRPSRAIGEGGEEPPWDDHEREESGSMDRIDAAEDGSFTSSMKQTIEDDARRSIAALIRKQRQRHGSTQRATKRKAGR